MESSSDRLRAPIRPTGPAPRATGGIVAALAALLAVTMLAGCGIVADFRGDTGSDARSSESPDPGPTPDPSPAEPGGTDGPVPEVTMVEHADRVFMVITLPLVEWDVSVEWDPDASGVMLRDVIADDPSIRAATNAGIFTPEMRPGGLLVSDGDELRALNLADGSGNFHLMPNGVFAVMADGTAMVVESGAYAPDGVRHATQSGPMLVIDGEIHPQFTDGSTNLALRSGVGVSDDGATVHLAMSWGVTNLWDFATLFRDELDVDNALYLDGQISDIWVAGMDAPGPVAGPYAGLIVARPHG